MSADHCNDAFSGCEPNGCLCTCKGCREAFQAEVVAPFVSKPEASSTKPGHCMDAWDGCTENDCWCRCSTCRGTKLDIQANKADDERKHGPHAARDHEELVSLKRRVDELEAKVGSNVDKQETLVVSRPAVHLVVFSSRFFSSSHGDPCSTHTVVMAAFYDATDASNYASAARLKLDSARRSGWSKHCFRGVDCFLADSHEVVVKPIGVE